LGLDSKWRTVAWGFLQVRHLISPLHCLAMWPCCRHEKQLKSLCFGKLGSFSDLLL
jgi:hypothetical protein